MDGYEMKTIMRAERVMKRLYEATSEEEAVECLRGEGVDVFRFIDEKQGYFGKPYSYCDGFMYLRRARNDAMSNLFDVLLKEVQECK